MDIKEIIDTCENPEPIWVAYPESKTFQVLLRPAGIKQEEFMEKARRIEWDEALMERRVVVDREAYLTLYNPHTIVDWKGLHVSDLRRLVLIKNFRKVMKFKDEIACDDTARMLLMQHSPLFSAWVKQTTRNIELFNAERERISGGN